MLVRAYLAICRQVHLTRNTSKNDESIFSFLVSFAPNFNHSFLCFHILNIFFHRRPIEHGMYSDSSEGEKKTSTDLQKELFEKFSPHINRKDASLLRRLLPQLHDTLVTIRSSSDQDKLIKTYKNCCEEYGDSNFFRYEQGCQAMNG